MTETRLITLSGSASSILVSPGWGTRESHERSGAAQRSRSGVLHVCAWGVRFRMAVPLSHVEPAARDTLAAWWREQARLAWVRAEGGRFETHVVRMTNGSMPLARRLPPAGERAAGTITLLGESAGAAPVPGAPFILDHATFGTLDTHNVLL